MDYQFFIRKIDAYDGTEEFLREIDEPIGFDGFSIKMQRSNYHGISAEFSEKVLEFYGKAIDIIKDAFDEGLDSELQFIIKKSCGDNGNYDELYRGVLDLSTYEYKQGDYCSVRCKVGEIGQRTTFNSRVETNVLLSSGQTIDGKDLAIGSDKTYSNYEREIKIPGMGLPMESRGKMSVVDKLKVAKESPFFKDQSFPENRHHLYIGFSDSEISELGAIKNEFTTQKKPIYIADKKGKFTIEYNLNFHLVWDRKFYRTNYIVCLRKNDELIVEQNSYSYAPNDNNERFVNKDKKIEIDLEQGDKLYFYIRYWFCIEENYPTGAGGGVSLQEVPVYVRKKEISDNNQVSYFKVFRKDMETSVYGKIAFVHEVLNGVCDITSGLTVRSDWYSRKDSAINPLKDVNRYFGSGSLKTLTTGARLRRGRMTGSNNITPLKFCFKDLIQNLNAIDNVGWGFSLEMENGSPKLFIRVEPMAWFYKKDLELLVVDNVQNISRKVDVKRVYNRAEIGYEKYAELNKGRFIDAIHTKREYSNGLKAVKRTYKKLSKFIADGYLIEEARRKALDPSHKDESKDEDVFILEVGGSVWLDGFIEYFVVQGLDVKPIFKNRILSPETVFNPRLTPRRNAEKHKQSLFYSLRNNEFRFISGTGNYFVVGKGMKHEPDDLFVNYYLEEHTELTSWGANGVYEYLGLGVGFGFYNPFLRAEILKFEYPLKWTDYKRIKDNPYGYILVNGEKCFIWSVDYVLDSGLCKFELIPSF